MVFEKIVAVLKEKLGDDVAIERETLLRDLGVDSLDVAEILMTLEDEFGIQIDTDGVKQGFDLKLLCAVCEAVSVPVIASGGAGSAAHFIELFQTLPKVDAGLAASIFHFGEVKIPD